MAINSRGRMSELRADPGRHEVEDPEHLYHDDAPRRANVVPDDQENEEEQGGSLSRFIANLVHKSVVESIPVDKLRNAKKSHVVLYGFARSLVLLFIFVYFIVVTYLSNQRAPYLAAEPDGGNCKEVPKSVSGVFIHSYDGRWNNQAGFNPARGYLMLSLSGLEVDNHGWQELMQDFQHKFLEPMGVAAKTQPPHVNLLNWFHFTGDLEVDGKLQSLSFTGETNPFFAGGSYSFALASNKFMSLAYPIQRKYDGKMGQLELVFDDDTWTSTSAKSVCLLDSTTGHPHGRLDGFSIDVNILPKELLGWTKKFSSGQVKISFDLGAITVGVAHNLGVPNHNLAGLDLKDSYSMVHNGVTYALTATTDVTQKGMTPLVCASKMSGEETVTSAHPFDDFCFVQVGWFSSGLPMLGVPGFNHEGYFNGGLVPSKCACPLVYSNTTFFAGEPYASTTSVRARQACQDFLIVSSVAFFPDREKYQGASTLRTVKDAASGSTDSVWFFPESVSDVPGLKDFCDTYGLAYATFEQPHADFLWLPAHSSFLEVTGWWSTFPDGPFTQEWIANRAAYLLWSEALWYSWALDHQIGPLIDLVSKYSPRDLNDDKIWLASDYGFVHMLNETCPVWTWTGTFIDEIRSAADPFAFCDHSCTVMSVQIGNGVQNTYAINSNMLQMPWLACNDTFNLNASSFDHLKSTPPTELVEQYYRCIPFASDAMTSAIGIASGWVATVAPLAGLFFSGILFACLKARNDLPAVGLETVRQQVLVGKVKSAAVLEIQAELGKHISKEVVKLVPRGQGAGARSGAVTINGASVGGESGGEGGGAASLLSFLTLGFFTYQRQHKR